MSIFKKRLSGSSVLSDMIPVIITLIITGMLGVMFSMWVSQFEQKEAVNSIVREYLLRMDTVGCLNEEVREALKQELQNHKVKNISFAGTTFTPVEYGEPVILKITGSMEIKQMKMETIFQWNSNEAADVSIDIERTATALY